MLALMGERMDLTAVEPVRHCVEELQELVRARHTAIVVEVWS
jgi:hypothetical protein